jgi:hypothetical protein
LQLKEVRLGRRGREEQAADLERTRQSKWMETGAKMICEDKPKREGEERERERERIELSAHLFSSGSLH